MRATRPTSMALSSSRSFAPGSAPGAGASVLVSPELVSRKRFLDQEAVFLPDTFDVKAVKKLESTHCMLCEEKFTRIRNGMKNCKRCGKAICDVCSLNKRPLARDNKEELRVCDLCDTEMDNFKLLQNHKDCNAA